MPSVCVGCDIGEASSHLATILAIIGAVTGAIGTLVGVLGFLKSEEAARLAVFREEFERHRVPLETSIQSMKRIAIVLHKSAHKMVPIATMLSNFQIERSAVNGAVEALLTEADEIDLRKLSPQSWVLKFRKRQVAIDEAWDILDDDTQPEDTSRLAAAALVANLDALIGEARDEISTCVRRPPSFWSKKSKGRFALFGKR